MFSMMSISPHAGQPLVLIVVAQHPERGPDPLAVGDPDARFRPPISERELALRLQARRSELARRWLQRLDHQMARPSRWELARLSV